MPQIQNMRTASISISTIGDNTVIAAPTTVNGAGFGDITVWQMNINGAGANVIQPKSGSTAVGGTIVFTAAGSAPYAYTGAPWIKCAAGQALVFNLTTTGAITGELYYTLG